MLTVSTLPNIRFLMWHNINTKVNIQGAKTAHATHPSGSYIGRQSDVIISTSLNFHMNPTQSYLGLQICCPCHSPCICVLYDVLPCIDISSSCIVHPTTHLRVADSSPHDTVCAIFNVSEWIQPWPICKEHGTSWRHGSVRNVNGSLSTPSLCSHILLCLAKHVSDALQCIVSCHISY